MQALVRGLQHETGILPRLLPALCTAAGARITTVAGARITTTATAGAGPITEAIEQSNSSALTREFQIYRWHPEDGGKPRYQSYNVDLNKLVISLPRHLPSCFTLLFLLKKFLV